ncbi:DUF2837 family protein [Heliobacterium gestii]|uniref:Lipid II flippase Amj n=1 Tax=Heliomicrobium gestii TaxID=2699 RepID=A0A845LHI5_HELGE|nr:lipid II flippase Amj family protein [Heliomicrobium gestii]MBM7866898.1 hypothetical protein [Heliomicrobium gestii]MZP42326.1 DUF2837 family protein [Heliomicrobium gestii]
MLTDFRLTLIFGLTAFIHMFQTFNYSVRLAGVRTRRVSMAYSLFSVLFLLASTANTFQAPLMAKGIEASNLLLSNISNDSSQAYLLFVESVDRQLRCILLGATTGTVCGTLLIPSFTRIFSKSILLLEKAGSVPKLLLATLSFRRFKHLLEDVQLPNVAVITRMREERTIPTKTIILNIIVTAIFSTGVLSAMYAGVLAPEYRQTAGYLAAVINGMATILLATLIDPVTAIYTDEAINGKRSEEEVKSLVMYMAFSRIAGTLFAQLLLLPSAKVIQFVTRVI